MPATVKRWKVDCLLFRERPAREFPTRLWPQKSLIFGSQITLARELRILDKGEDARVGK